MNLRNFLMRHPRPSTVRVQLLDGTNRTITVDPKVPWIQLAAYIAELEPEAIECLDPEGHVLRGTSFESLDESETGDELELAHTMPIPVTAKMKAPEDAESQRLVLFAQLLADAYRHTTDVAFDKMISLFEQVNKRYEHTEKALDRMQKIVERLTEQRLAQAEAADDLTLSELASAWTGGQQQHAAEHSARPPSGPPQPRREPPPPGGYANGKAHA
jgi:hypothetical protein